MVAQLVSLISSAAHRVRRPAYSQEFFFRFGSLRVRLRSDDVAFSTRFARIFHDCRESPGLDSDGVRADLDVRSSGTGNAVVAEISDHDCSATTDVLRAFFPELDLVRAEGKGEEGWHLFANSADHRRVVVAARGNELVLDRELPWQRIVAHYFLNHVFRLQPEFFFFHGASIAVGNHGVFLSGSKGSGKSTLSLAMAARGHAFLGDELAVIHGATGMMLPFPRAVSIRLGPQAQAVAHYLTQNPVDRETLPDGTERLRLPPSQIFPAAAGRPVPLTHAFFLDRAADLPAPREFGFSQRHLPLLGPLHATLTSVPPALRTVRFLKLFGEARCYIFPPRGTPDESAGLLESIVESKWDTAFNRERSVSAPFAG